MNVDPALLTPLLSGILVGIPTGMVAWSLFTESDLVLRISLGGLIGAIIQIPIELMRRGKSLGSAFLQGMGSPTTSNDYLLSVEFLALLDHILVAIGIGAAIAALLLATNRALAGGFMGVIFGALLGIVTAVVFQGWQLPAGGLLFHGVIAMAVAGLFTLFDLRG